MLLKIKNFFIRPSRFDKAIYSELQELSLRVKNLDEHLVTVARLALIKPDRLMKESTNIKANAEYLISLVKAKDGGK